MQLPGASSKKYVELREFNILPEHRGKGLGQRLLGFLLNYTDRRRLCIKLDVWKSNTIAIHCYVKHGFKKVLWRHPACQWINDPENLFEMYNITEPKEKVFLYVREPPSE
jgi:ribosomal protein S18 acetylase RimI-like enzyme